MVNATHLRLHASDRSYFAIIKKEIHALASQAGFSAKKLGELDIIIAEMVSNLGKHAIGGELFAKLVVHHGIQGIEVICTDAGPGMADVNRMMLDGTSTKKTLGQGLGAIKRLSDFCQIYSQQGWGTILVSRMYNAKLPPAKKPEPLEVHSLLVPKPGETACGDGFYFTANQRFVLFFLGDGLGHGKEASIAVNAAIDAVKLCFEETPVEMIRYIHQSVKRTRGLVGTVAVLDLKERLWKVLGVGNITTRMYSPSGLGKTHNSYNGIIGHNIPNTMKAQEVAYEPGQMLQMCSDGIRSKWELHKFPGIQRFDLGILNAALFKDFARNTDDMSIISSKIFV
jgi:anti-sigma regulatory factor (Ser/Thr protein kinase)